MAESTLSVTLNSLRQDVGPSLGFPRVVANWTNTQLTDFDNIVRRGLRWFYFPGRDAEQPFYEWSFLHKTGTILLVNGTSAYDLTDDFTGSVIDDSFTFAASSDNRKLKPVGEATIRAHQAKDPLTGTPRWFAIRNKEHDTVNGQRWEVLVYPTPTANATVTYRYVYVPNMITNSAPYPVGGARYSGVVQLAVEAAAEQYLDDDPAGPAYQRFLQELNSAIRADTQFKDSM